MSAGVFQFACEPNHRFSSAAIHSKIVGTAYPALATSTAMGHASALAWSMAITKARMEDSFSFS